MNKYKLTVRQRAVLEVLAGGWVLIFWIFTDGDRWKMYPAIQDSVGKRVHTKTARSLENRGFLAYCKSEDVYKISPAGRKALNEQS